MSLFKLIDAEKAYYPISLLCRVLRVSRSGYYNRKDRPLSKTARENAALTERIGRIHRDSRGTYGAPRIHARLQAEGMQVGNKRVARLMRKAGLEGCHHRRKKTPRTTSREIHGPCPPPTSWSETSPSGLPTAPGWRTSRMCQPGRVSTI